MKTYSKELYINKKGYQPQMNKSKDHKICGTLNYNKK